MPAARRGSGTGSASGRRICHRDLARSKPGRRGQGPRRGLVAMRPDLEAGLARPLGHGLGQDPAQPAPPEFRVDDQLAAGGLGRRPVG